MKKIIFQMSLSIDGYVEGPNREIDWQILDDDFDAYAVEALKAADLLIMGRKTYQLMESYWPTASSDDPITEHVNSRPKLVFSRTLERVDWQNSRLATGSVAEEVAALKQAPGDGLILVGGSDLAVSFLEKGLIDEIRIILAPISAGCG